MSSREKIHAVIFKSVSDLEDEHKDIYYETLCSAGFQVTLIPVLDFEFVNLDQFLCKIKNPDKYAGIIFSSPRCVMGFELSIKKSNESLIEKWANNKHFVVGEKTAMLAENLGLVVFGKDAGNGDNLVKIISKDKYDKPFLYPIGSLTKKHFKLKLKENDIDVDEINIYNTKQHSEMEINIAKLKPQLINKAICFIYFSPSGVNFSLPVLKKLQFDLSCIKFIAIGPTTEAGLLESGLKVAKTALKPNPSAVLDAIMSLKN